jgi:TRAP transporter TAXI family solute receptor
MKKRTTSLLSLLCALVAVLTACGSSLAAQSKELLLVTSTSTSSYYAIGAGIVDLINKANLEFTMSATTSGGTEDNLVRIEAGEAEMGIGMPDSVNAAATGTGAYESRPIKVRALCSLWVNPFNIVVRQNSGITSPEQLKGLRCATGPAGTSSRNFPEALFPVLGFEADDCIWSYAPIGDQCNKLKDGQIDAITMTMGHGNSSLTDLASTTDVVWLGLPMNVIEEVKRRVPFYSYTVIKAGTYPGIKKDVNTIGFRVSVFASTETVSEEQAYQILKAIYDNPGALGRYHSVGAECTLDVALEGLATELHPGAVKFFKEKGML